LGQWLALRQSHPLSPEERTAALAGLPAARIGLIPASRPADVLALTGFNGTVNRYGTPAEMTAVLRSWEDRFGAALLEVGFASFSVLVTRPPRTLAAAQAAAAEIWAMCDEFWASSLPIEAFTTVGEIADYIVRSPIWSMWLD
jgi:hypothetical protein